MKHDIYKMNLEHLVEPENKCSIKKKIKGPKSQLNQLLRIKAGAI